MHKCPIQNFSDFGCIVYVTIIHARSCCVRVELIARKALVAIHTKFRRIPILFLVNSNYVVLANQGFEFYALSYSIIALYKQILRPSF